MMDNILISNETLNLEAIGDKINELYDCVYLLVKVNDTPIPSEFYNPIVSIELFNKVSKNLIIYKVDLDILKIKMHTNNLLLLKSEDLVNYNIFNYDLKLTNLVIPILNIKYENLHDYINQYNSSGVLKRIYNFVLLNKYFKTDAPDYHYKLYELINSYKLNSYWTNPNNFKKDLSSIYTIIKTKDSHKFLNGYSYQDNNNNYNILSTSQNNKQIKLELPEEPGPIEDFTNKDMESLFNMLDDKYKFLLFSNLLVSYKYCHLVINNYEVLKSVKPLMNGKDLYFQSLLSYTWLKLYIDEFNNKLDNNMFDINTASLLPIYKVDYKNPTSNPYIPLLDCASVGNTIDDKVSGLNPLISQGINDIHNFKKLLNIYCTYYSDKDIFEGINFNKYNACIVGSVISACIQKKHPLLYLIKSANENEHYSAFFSEYYANSDVDIMFVINNYKQTDNPITNPHNIEYLDKIHEFYNEIMFNVCKINKYAEVDHIKIKTIKFINISINEKFIRENIKSDKFNKMTSAELKTYFNKVSKQEDIDLIFPYYIDYIDNKMNQVININEYKLNYPELFEYTNQIRINYDENYEFNVDYVFKFHIKSPYLAHHLELFGVRQNKSYSSIISRFHLPCIRGYYDGNNVYLTPSCVSAHLTFMNIDSHYISCNTELSEIIIKYHIRGFGTFISKSNKRELTQYIYNKKKIYENIYGEGNNKSLLGNQSIFSKVYKPRQYLPELFLNADYVDIENRYYDNIQLKNNIITANNNSNMITIDDNGYIFLRIAMITDNKTAINEQGEIKILNKWIIDKEYDTYYNIIKPVKSSILNKKRYKISDHTDTSDSDGVD